MLRPVILPKVGVLSGILHILRIAPLTRGLQDLHGGFSFCAIIFYEFCNKKLEKRIRKTWGSFITFGQNAEKESAMQA